MSKLLSLYTCHERIIDKNGNEISYHETNLPHAKEIEDAFINSWNDQADFMCDLMNKDAADNRVESCKARHYKGKPEETTIAVEIISKPGKQFRQTIKENIFDFMSAQFSDGWGEGFFGPVNKITAKNGTVFCIE